MSLRIIGAGMAGLLAAHILRRHNPVVLEAQPELPNNHKALLRFRSMAVADATGIPFKRVKVLKGIWDHRSRNLLGRATLDLSNMYSLKVIGTIHGRSVVNLEPTERYIAPEDFIARLADGLNIEFNRKLDALEQHDLCQPLVSTIPMPALMKLMGIQHTHEFRSQEIWTVNVDIIYPQVDVYQTVYFPDPSHSLYRVSVIGRRMIFEFTSEPKFDVHNESKAMEHIFGMPGLTLNEKYDLSSQRYGKILPIDDDARRAFILMATDKYNIYSVGRFATWRQILLDDVVKDCQFVDTMLKQRDRYASKFLTAPR